MYVLECVSANVWTDAVGAVAETILRSVSLFTALLNLASQSS